MYGLGLTARSAAVDGERRRRRTGVLKRCESTTWKASPAWMYSRMRSTPASYCSRVMDEDDRPRGGPRRVARPSTWRRRRQAGRSRGAARAAWPCTSAMRSTARSYGPSTSRPVDEGVGDHRDGVLEVVEHEDRVGEQEGHLGQAEVVGRRVRQVLEASHEVVAEVARRGRRPAAVGRCRLSARPRRPVALISRRRRRTGRRARRSRRSPFSCTVRRPSW